MSGISLTVRVKKRKDGYVIQTAEGKVIHVAYVGNRPSPKGKRKKKKKPKRW